MKKNIFNYSSFRISILLGLFLLLSVTSTFAQNISGKVTDSNNEILIGVNVLEKGTNNGTTTDANGLFKINLTKKGGILIVSYVGYDSKEVNASANMVIVLREGNILKEVIVSAENRNVSAQKVPITMDLVSGTELASRGVVDLSRLQTLAPSLNIMQDNIFNQITVRGVGNGQNASAELGDQAITVGVDGEYINRPVALNATMFDLERVEVLKGPQGTLYGRNATAGAINIIAKKPKLNSTEGNVSASFGNYNSLNLNGAINLPLGKIAAVRVAALKDKHDGYINGGPAGDINDGNVFAARLGVLLKPSEKFSAYVAGEFNRTDQKAPAQFGIVLNNTMPGVVNGESPVNYSTDLPNDFDIAVPGFLKIDQLAFRTKLQYDFGEAKITYTGGYRDVDLKNYQPINGFIPETASFDNDLEYQTQSHEFRINGETENEKFIWQAGYFYGNEDQNAGRGFLLSFARPNYFFYYRQEINSKTNAIFGQATYKVGNNFGITLGLRNTTDKKSRLGGQVASGSGYTYPEGGPKNVTDPGVPSTFVDGKWNQTTWLLNFEYKIDNSKYLFAKMNTGYKAGGFDNVGQYKAESITAYEIGSKNKFANNKLRLNASIFYYDYRDQQVSIFIDTNVGAAVQNVDGSSVTGAELDGEFLATENDRFTFSANYLDAQYGDFVSVVNTVRGPNVPIELKGKHPVQSPKWTLTGGYTHDFKLGESTLSAALNTIYKSDYYLSVSNFNMDKQVAYTNTSFRLIFTGKSRNWDLAAYVNNIEDNRILNYASFTGAGTNGPNTYNWMFGSPRTIGAQLNYRF